MDKSIQTPAPKPNNIRSFDLISIESSEIVLNLLQSELFEELNMPLLSYISDKDLEELSKGLCSESAFCEFFRGLFQYGESDILFSAYLLYRRRLPFGRLSNRNNEKSEYMVALQYWNFDLPNRAMHPYIQIL